MAVLLVTSLSARTFVVWWKNEEAAISCLEQQPNPKLHAMLDDL
jgi:hypothetical protein